MKRIALLICSLLMAAQLPAQKTVDGVKFSACINKELSADFYKNKFLVLDFWATWCGPCIGSFPRVKQFEHKYKNNNKIVFATISSESKSKIDLFYSRNKDKMPEAAHLVDDSGATWRYYDVDHIPVILVFSPQGKLVFRGRIEELAPHMDRILKGKNMLPAENPRPVPVQNDWQRYKERADFIALTGPIAAGDESGMNSCSFDGDTTKVNCKNSIIEVVGYLGGLTETRISATNPMKGNKLIDLYYKQTKNSFPEFDKGIFDAQYKNHVLHVLEQNYGFHCEWATAKGPAWKIIVKDAAVLEKSATISTYGSGSSMMGPKKIHFTNFSLPGLAASAENEFGQIFFPDKGNEKGYDVDIDFSSMPVFEKSLATYGLALEKVDGYEVKKLRLVFD